MKASLDTSKINTVLLAFLALIGCGFILYILRELLLPLIIAGFFSVLFKPILLYLRRKHVPSGLAVLIVMLCVIVMFGLLGFVMFTGVQSVVEAAPRYQERLNSLIHQASGFVESSAKGLGKSNGKMNLADAVQMSSVASVVAASVGSVLNFLENVILILLFLVFLLAGSEEFQGKIGKAFSSKESSRVKDVIGEVNHRVRSYLVMKSLINIGVGILTSVVMLLFGVDFALLIGLVTFFLNYIPNFGALMAVALPAVVALLQFDSIGLPLLVIGSLVVMHNVIGNLIEPKLLGMSLNLSPLIILLALIFWGWIWGIMGMVLAVPITSVIKIIFENIEPLNPFAVLMSTTREG